VSDAQNPPLEPASHPPKIAAKIAGRAFTLLLGTPLYRFLPSDVILLTVRNRETGEDRTLTVEHHDVNGRMAVLTSSRWRSNVRGGARIVVTHKGKRRPAHAELVEDHDEVTRVYQTLLNQYGLDNVDRIGFAIKEHRNPTFEELKALVAGNAVVYLDFEGSGSPEPTAESR